MGGEAGGNQAGVPGGGVRGALRARKGMKDKVEGIRDEAENDYHFTVIVAVLSDA